MKFEVILIKKYKYLIHYAEGTSSKNLPEGLESGKDLIVDFTVLNNSDGNNALKIALTDFILSICEGKTRQAKVLEKLAPHKKFILTSAAALNVAVENAKQQGANISSVLTNEELISTKPNRKSERGYDRFKLNNLKAFAKEGILRNSFFDNRDKLQIGNTYEIASILAKK
jgi:hypothetical protein